MALGMEVGLGPSDIVLDGTPAPLPQKGCRPPIFGPFLLSPNGWMHEDATWYGVGLSPRDVVLDGNPAPSQQRGGAPFPIFGPFLLWPNGWMHQDATWYGVGLSQGDFVLDADPAPLLPKKEAEPGGRDPSIFGPCLLWPNGWMDQDGTWRGGRPWSSPHRARWGHSSPPKKGGKAPSIFGSSLFWPNGWMHQDATWYGSRPQRNGLCLRWGPRPRAPKGGGAPQFSAHIYFGPAAGWVKLVHGMEEGLSPGDLALDGDPALPLQKAGGPFRSMFIATKRLDE